MESVSEIALMPTDWAASPGIVETHISTLIFLGDRAYKLHKPLKTAFLDHSTRSKRRRACHEEVALNRRFAPDVYLGVVDVAADDGTPKEHVIAMKRMPADRQLSRLLGLPGTEEHLGQIAEILSNAHAATPPVRRRGMGDWRQVRQLWHEGMAQMSRFAGAIVSADQLADVGRRARRYLSGRRPLFDLRVSQGRVRDGHGDLLADDIYCLPDGPRILDCLAFDRALRVGDTLSDAAFLSMDIESRGHRALAERFLETYAEKSDDWFPPSLAYHYLAYRAFVRSKIACLASEQGRTGKAERAAELLELTESYLRRGRVRLILVGGTPGTGKSTLASGLADVCGFPLVRSDSTRKLALGIAPSTSAAAEFGAGIYTPETTRRVYSAMLDSAARFLEHGYSVVLDASWSNARDRLAARRVAADRHADLHEFRCEVDASEADRRIAARGRAGADPSDATAAIAEQMRAAYDAWPEAIVVNTLRPPKSCVESVAADLGLELPQPGWVRRSDPQSCEPIVPEVISGPAHIG